METAKKAKKPVCSAVGKSRHLTISGEMNANNEVVVRLAFRLGRGDNCRGRSGNIIGDMVAELLVCLQEDDP